MKNAIVLVLVAAFATGSVPKVAPASDFTAEIPAGNFGNLYVYYPTGEVVTDPALIPGITPVVVYDNTSSAPNAGISAPNPYTTWGDELLMTGRGKVEEQALTIFNSAASGNTGSLFTATIQVRYFNRATLSFIGGFEADVDFGAGLMAGFFSTVTFTGLSGLNINLTVNPILITQRIIDYSGTSRRFGVVSLSPVTVGSSPPYFYVNDGSNPPGLYTLGSGVPADVGYRIALFPDPTPTGSDSWGSVKAFYRR